MIYSCWKCYDDHWTECASFRTACENEERSELTQLQSHQHVSAHKNHQISSKTNIKRCFVHIISLWSGVHETKIIQQTSEDEHIIEVSETSDLVLQNCSSWMNIWEALQISYVVKDLLRLCHLECTMLNFNWQQHSSWICVW